MTGPTRPGPEARHWGQVPLFDPERGETVREPQGQGPGWWVGAPSAIFDVASAKYYLYYRYRKPGELGRGVECRIAESQDGTDFSDIWSATKADLGTQSMEKAGLFQGGGSWHLYLSFVGDDGRWRIEGLTAARPEDFDVRRRTPVLDADDCVASRCGAEGCGAEGVKDPAVYSVGGLQYMIVSYAPRPRAAAAPEALHGAGDVYNTGLVKSHTGLALSTDGAAWRWAGDILTPPVSGWDCQCTRIGAMVWEAPVWVGFYDGSASVAENYEEKPGLCVSTDLRHWERVTTAGPYAVSPHASGAIRYVEVVPLPTGWRYYYEYTRADGSHELRTSFVPR